MNYRSHTNRTFFGVPTSLIVTMSTTVLLIGLVFLFGGYITNLTGSGKNVFTNIGEYIKTSVQDKSDLLKEIEILEDERKKLETDRLIFQAHHQAYLDLLQQTLSIETDTHVAPVIAKPPFSPYDTYILETEDIEVESNSLVVSQNRFVIGFTDAGKNSVSKATLFSYPGLETIVSIEGEQYRAVGQGGGVLKIKLPRSYAETDKKTVSISGVPNYILGYVEVTEFDPQDSFVTGILVLPVNIYTQDLVSISHQKYRNVEDIVNEINEEESDTQ